MVPPKTSYRYLCFVVFFFSFSEVHKITVLNVLNCCTHVLFELCKLFFSFIKTFIVKKINLFFAGNWFGDFCGDKFCFKLRLIIKSVYKIIMLIWFPFRCCCIDWQIFRECGIYLQMRIQGKKCHAWHGDLMAKVNWMSCVLCIQCILVSLWPCPKSNFVFYL